MTSPRLGPDERSWQAQTWGPQSILSSRQSRGDVIALSPTAGLPPCPLWPAPRLPHQPFQQTLHRHHRFTLPYKGSPDLLPSLLLLSPTHFWPEPPLHPGGKVP